MKPALVCGPSAWTPPRLLEGVPVLLDLGKNFPWLMSGLGGGLSFCVGVPLRPSSLWSRAWILFQCRSPSPPTYPPARVRTDAHARAHTGSPTKALLTSERPAPHIPSVNPLPREDASAGDANRFSPPDSTLLFQSLWGTPGEALGSHRCLRVKVL